MLLVDSDWIISDLGGQAAALALLGNLRAQGFAISAITVGEVLEGVYLDPDVDASLARYRRNLEGFVVLEVNGTVADVFARIRALLRKQGNLIPDMDLLIAATALAFDLTLLSRNRRHLARVPGLRLYQPA